MPAERGAGRVGARSTTLARNFVALLFGNFASRALGFLAVIYLTRTLGPHGYGELSWALAAYNFALYTADLGLPTIGIRRLAQDPEQIPSTVSNIFGLRLALTVAAAGVLCLFGLLTGQTATVRLLTALYSLALVVNGVAIEWVFTGLQRMQFIGLARLVQYVIYPALLVVWVREAESVWRVPLASAAAGLAAAVFLFAMFHRARPGRLPRPQRSAWRGLLRTALPLGVSQVLLQVYLNAPILLLGWMQGEAATGYYAGAYRVMQVLYEGVVLFLLTFSPLAASRWLEGPAAIGALLERVQRLGVVLVLPVAVMALVLGPQLFVLMLGPEFGASALPFQVMVWNLVLLAINGVYVHLGLLMGGRQRAYMLVVGLAAGSSLVLNLLLIPSQSYMGAAWSWVLAEVWVVVAGYLLVRRGARMGAVRHLWRPLAAGAGMAGCSGWLAALGAPALLAAAAGLVVYGALLLLLGGITREELAMLRSALSRRAPTATVDKQA